MPAPPVRDRLWSLFGHIVRRWSDADPQTMRSNWLVFIANRQRVDAAYATWFAQAASMLDERVAALGEAAAIEELLGPKAESAQTGWALTLVRDEFIALFLSLGGFKAYGALNYRGYIAGANVPGETPYRTARADTGGGTA